MAYPWDYSHLSSCFPGRITQPSVRQIVPNRPLVRPIRSINKCDDHFPFLRLPKEIRLMIYERLPQNIKPIGLDFKYTRKLTEHAAVALITNCIDPTILRTCRMIYDEARPLIERHYHREMIDNGAKIIVDMTKPEALWALSAILKTLNERKSGFFASEWSNRMNDARNNLVTRLISVLESLEYSAGCGGMYFSSIDIRTDLSPKDLPGAFAFIEQAAAYVAHYENLNKESKADRPMVQVVIAYTDYWSDLQNTNGYARPPQLDEIQLFLEMLPLDKKPLEIDICMAGWIRCGHMHELELVDTPFQFPLDPQSTSRIKILPQMTQQTWHEDWLGIPDPRGDSENEDSFVSRVLKGLTALMNGSKI